MNIGLLLLLAMLALALIMFGSSLYFMFCMRKAVFAQLRDLEDIRATGQPPERWRKGFLRKCQKGKADERDWQRQRRRECRRLRGVERFARTTKLMESEETRKDVLSQLAAIRRDWETAEMPQ